MNESPFNPEMLTLARQAREVTQGELAEISGVSQGRISKIEHGLVMPNNEEELSLAKAVAYPVSFFHQAGHNYAPPLRHHRKRVSISQKTLNRIHAEMNIRALQIRQLLKSATFEAELPLKQIDPDEYAGRIEDIARSVRSAWRLPRGPIQNIVRLLERAGVIIVPVRLGGIGFDAMTHIVPGMPPLVFVNEDAPMDRIRFTLAHELGHLIMHAFANPEMEDQAQRFAAEFLMPTEDIAPQLSRVSLPILATLKVVWRVSMAALLYRAMRIGSITERQYVRLRTEMARLGYSKREPSHLDVSREEPGLLISIFKFHIESLKYGLEDLSRVLNDFPDRIRSFYLPAGSGGLQLLPAAGRRAFQ